MIRDLIEESLPFFSEAMSSLGVPDSDWLRLFGKATVEDHADVALPCHSLAKVPVSYTHLTLPTKRIV